MSAPGQTPVLRSTDPTAVDFAAQVLRADGVVAFPTETVYGLGAAALHPAAVARIFAAKGRPADNPLIVHVAELAAAEELCREFPAAAQRLAAALWPGPLTLVLHRRPGVVPDITTAGLDTVAVRIPSHPVALALLRATGLPLAAPSANRSGRPSPTTAAHVVADMDGRIDLILDGGPTDVGLESTVLDVTGPVPMLLRRGVVGSDQLAQILGHPVAVLADDSAAAAVASPGLRHRHYAPRAVVELVAEGSAEQAVAAAVGRGETVGVVVRRPIAASAGVRVQRLPAALAGYAQALFASLRALDAASVDRIIVETVPASDGVGAAIMDRLRRAAAG